MKNFFQEDILYTLTISPKDSYQHFNKNDRFSKCMRSIKGLLAQIGHAEYDMVPEISNGGRFHVHGTIKIYKGESVDFALYDIPRIAINQYEIDTIDDINIWNTYVSKDEQTIKPYCKRKGLQYRIHNKPPPKQKSINDFFMETQPFSDRSADSAPETIDEMN